MLQEPGLKSGEFILGKAVTRRLIHYFTK